MTRDWIDFIMLWGFVVPLSIILWAGVTAGVIALIVAFADWVNK